MAATTERKPQAPGNVTPYENYKGADPAAPIPLGILAARVAEYKELDSKLQSADGDKAAAVKAWYENSDHAEAVKLRKAIELATQKLHELAEKNAQVVTMSDDEKAKAKASLTKLKDEIRAGQKAITDTAQMIGVDFEGVKAAIEEIGDPSRSNRGRKPGESGSSVPRAYVIATVTGGNFTEPMVYDTFSKVASLFHVEVVELQREFAKAAGVDPSDVAKVDKPVTFEFQPNGNGSVYTISTKPKPRQKPGRKPKAETSSAANQSTESKPAETA